MMYVLCQLLTLSITLKNQGQWELIETVGYTQVSKKGTYLFIRYVLYKHAGTVVTDIRGLLGTHASRPSFRHTLPVILSLKQVQVTSHAALILDTINIVHSNSYQPIIRCWMFC